MEWYWLELRNKNERVKLLEDREKEMDNIKDVLDSADSYNHSWTFYIHKWRYFREVLRKLNDTVILADIFGKNMDKFISNKENTDIALKVYEEEILKGNWIVLDNIEDMIKKSNWELQYNLLRIRERFDEMGKIFEKEVFHLVKRIDDLAIDKWFWKKSNLIEEKVDFSKLNKLTVAIIDKYRKR